MFKKAKTATSVCNTNTDIPDLDYIADKPGQTCFLPVTGFNYVHVDKYCLGLPRFKTKV